MSLQITIHTTIDADLSEVLGALYRTGFDYEVCWLPEDDVDGDEVEVVLSALPPTDGTVSGYEPGSLVANLRSTLGRG